MGVLFSTRKFKPNKQTEGQHELALEIFLLLGFTPKDVDLLYTAFWDIDADGSGTIQPAELFAYFTIEPTILHFKVFSLFDEDHSGLINFMEFVGALWNMLTLPEQSIGCLGFMMIDPTGLISISYQEIVLIFETLHQRKVSSDPSLQLILADMKKEFANDLTMEQFVAFTAKNPSANVPLVMLQNHIRRQILGVNFWRKMSKERMEDQQQGQLTYLRVLKAEIIRRNNLFKKSLSAEQLRKFRLSRRGLGSTGENRNIVGRRESNLFKHFKLNRETLTSRFNKNKYGTATLPYDENGQDPTKKTEAFTHQIQGKTAKKVRRRRSSFLGMKPNLVIEEEKEQHRKKKKNNDPRKHPQTFEENGGEDKNHHKKVKKHIEDTDKKEHNDIKKYSNPLKIKNENGKKDASFDTSSGSWDNSPSSRKLKLPPLNLGVKGSPKYSGKKISPM